MRTYSISNHAYVRGHRDRASTVTRCERLVLHHFRVLLVVGARLSKHFKVLSDWFMPRTTAAVGARCKAFVIIGNRRPQLSQHGVCNMRIKQLKERERERERVLTRVVEKHVYLFMRIQLKTRDYCIIYVNINVCVFLIYDTPLRQKKIGKSSYRVNLAEYPKSHQIWRVDFSLILLDVKDFNPSKFETLKPFSLFFFLSFFLSFFALVCKRISFKTHRIEKQML